MWSFSFHGWVPTPPHPTPVPVTGIGSPRTLLFSVGTLPQGTLVAVASRIRDEMCLAPFLEVHPSLEGAGAPPPPRLR